MVASGSPCKPGILTGSPEPFQEALIAVLDRIGHGWGGTPHGHLQDSQTRVDRALHVAHISAENGILAYPLRRGDQEVEGELPHGCLESPGRRVRRIEDGRNALAGPTGDSGDTPCGECAGAVYPGRTGEVCKPLWSRISAIWRGMQWTIGENHIVWPARAGRVALDSVGLVFVDSDHWAAE